MFAGSGFLSTESVPLLHPAIRTVFGSLGTPVTPKRTLLRSWLTLGFLMLMGLLMEMGLEEMTLMPPLPTTVGVYGGAAAAAKAWADAGAGAGEGLAGTNSERTAVVPEPVCVRGGESGKQGSMGWNGVWAS